MCHIPCRKTGGRIGHILQKVGAFASPGESEPSPSEEQKQSLLAWSCKAEMGAKGKW